MEKITLDGDLIDWDSLIPFLETAADDISGEYNEIGFYLADRNGESTVYIGFDCEIEEVADNPITIIVSDKLALKEYGVYFGKRFEDFLDFFHDEKLRHLKYAI